MSNAAQDVQRYTAEVQAWLRGEGPATHLPQRPAPYKVPVYVAAITSRMVEQAAELADGIMPIFWSPERVRKSKPWIERGRMKATTDLGPCDLTLGIPEQGAGAGSLSNELLDSICLIGPIDRCTRRLAEYREAGVDLPILMAPLGVAGARDVISAFGAAVSV